MNLVSQTDSFAERYEHCELHEQEWIDKMRRQLAENLDVGKPLHYDWFREKKLKGKRLYFIINRQTQKVLFVAFSDKKEQQATISHVFSQRDIYLSLVR